MNLRPSGYEPDESRPFRPSPLPIDSCTSRSYDNKNPAHPKGFLARDGKNNGATAAQAKPTTARGCAPAKPRVPEVLQPLLSKLLSIAALLAALFDQGRQPGALAEEIRIAGVRQRRSPVVRNHAFRRFACPAKETPARAASAEPAEQTRSAKWDAPSAMCPLPRTTSIEAHPESTRSCVFYLHCKLNVIECMQCT